MTTARVELWGTIIGRISVEDVNDIAYFEYDSDFLSSGIEVCPLMMPLSKRVYSFPALSRESFHGLPGMLSDCLPDRFGNAVINAWLVKNGRATDSMNAVERLCYTGVRGMGALEFHPELPMNASDSESIQVGELVSLASEILNKKNKNKANIHDAGLNQLISVGTSAGGARAKAVIAINDNTGDIRSGYLSLGENYSYWLIKLDNVVGNKDKEEPDEVRHTVIEYAYYMMAVAAKIHMQESRLLDIDGGRHFLTRRFDRTNNGKKIHMMSLAGMAHMDYNQACVYSYEEVADIIKRLHMNLDSKEQIFRRMVFNVIAQNNDDHVKNISFLMDKSGKWTLAPAYDMTYAYNPGGKWTSKHQMLVNGKSTDIDLEDLIQSGKTMELSKASIMGCIEDVRSAVSDWMSYAEKAGVQEEKAVAIKETHEI